MILASKQNPKAEMSKVPSLVDYQSLGQSIDLEAFCKLSVVWYIRVGNMKYKILKTTLSVA